MNDRYLYRAKRCDNGEWVEGFLMDDNYINTPFNDNDVGGRFDDPVEIDPSIICQCTGLKDKNGKLIWENDIVNVSTNKGNTLCEARYADSVAQFQLWQLKTLPKTSTVLNLGNYEEEVCGSIFDNPELLESKGCD